MSTRFHVGRISFGPKPDANERQPLDTGKLLVAPKDTPVMVVSAQQLERLEQAVSRAESARTRDAAEIGRLQGERARLITTLLVAEAALARATKDHPGDTLYEFISDRLRLVLREWRVPRGTEG